MNVYQRFLLSVATGAPFAPMSEAGDVAPLISDLETKTLGIGIVAGSLAGLLYLAVVKNPRAF